jgi:hypothetical protein
MRWRTPSRRYLLPPWCQQVDIEVINDMMIRENNSFEIVELNTPRKGRHAKPDRIERLEPDIRDPSLSTQSDENRRFPSL